VPRVRVRVRVRGGRLGSVSRAERHSGCHPNRATLSEIDRAGFAVGDVTHDRLAKAPPIVRPLIVGHRAATVCASAQTAARGAASKAAGAKPAVGVFTCA
jgi:hypothetical protein